MDRKPKREKEKLPTGIKRKYDGYLIVNVEERFPDGTAFRRYKEFDGNALKQAESYLEKCKAELSRGNGVADPKTVVEGGPTVASWCAHCVSVSMPAQKNGRSPKYSDSALEGFRETLENGLSAEFGAIKLEELTKAAVSAYVAGLFSDEARSKVLNLLTRSMELAESKGKRRKGTNPAKGVAARPPRPKIVETTENV
ncbi:hypothetical protein BH11ARM1_BH11ARM1_08110 [soil metagenome]